MGRLRVLETGAGAADRLADVGDRLVLSDDPPVQGVLHVQEPLGLLLGDPGDRDPGPHRDDVGDVLLGDVREVRVELRPPLRAHPIHVLARGRLAVAQVGRHLVVLAVDRRRPSSLVSSSRAFWASLISGGDELFRRRTRLAASSMRSTALSGRCRSVM